MNQTIRASDLKIALRQYEIYKVFLMETILSLDEERDQYLWLQMDLQKYHRVHGITLHLRLHNDKI